MDNQVPKEVKERRVSEMIDLSNQLAKEYASPFEGEVLEVIPEEENGEQPGHLLGYSDNDLKVSFQGDASLIGSIVRVKIIKCSYPINEGVVVKVEDKVAM